VDPLIGATLRISNFKLSGPSGSGFLFEDGAISIFDADQVFFAATVPELLIDDAALSHSGLNIFGELLDSLDIDRSASPFLEHYGNFLLGTEFLPNLLGRTSIPVTAMIAAGQSFTVAGEGLSVGFVAVPGPCSLVLFGAGGVALLASLWRSRYRIASSG
jgi:hypothetical protein